MSVLSQLKANAGMLTGGASVVVVAATLITVVVPEPERAPLIGAAPDQTVSPQIVSAPANRVDETAPGQTAPAPRPATQAEVSDEETTTETVGEITRETAAETPGETPAETKTESPTETAGVSPEVATEGQALAPVAPGTATGLKLGGAGDTPVSVTTPDNSVVASVAPEAGPELATKPSERPKIGETTLPPGATEPLRFDLVRVDKTGSAVVAGKAPPGLRVEIYVDGEVIAEAVADARGGFVALFDLSASVTPQVITLATRDAGGNSTQSSERVVVMGREVVSAEVAPDESTPVAPLEEAAPAIILATDEGVKVIQPASIATDAPDVMANVSLDLISYDDAGEVILTGRGQVENNVRIYIDDKPVTTIAVEEDGTWQLSMPDVPAGRYTLRVDEIDSQGQVASRLETPFQKEEPAAVKRTASLAAPEPGDNGDSEVFRVNRVEEVTIQRGATLWALAKTNYGEGNLYMQIFNANRDSIRDPDLIYPGQIFTIPE
jgi:nucleoid-associated protein YgaU